MESPETVILCQPDEKKGCCACCGLFNFKELSRESLSRFLSLGRERSRDYRGRGIDADAAEGSAVRDIASYVCPHQGFIFEGRPGCLLHPRYGGNSVRNDSFFGEKICASFLCPAHSLLNEEQKRLIIAHVDDWYYYTIAMIDPGSVRWLLELLADTYRVGGESGGCVGRILNSFLSIHAEYLRAYPGPVFFYSASEYSPGSNGFSLRYGAGRLDREKRDIRAAIESTLTDTPLFEEKRQPYPGNR
ncbi:MAG: hypothetical protein A2W19_14575 [Spirochaetes bacterium RBG_16_49_21]|nr:MAG: hypothetical protein A2W19_14575 [Spirochaetes bacterium RBG_16_49_21]